MISQAHFAGVTSSCTVVALLPDVIRLEFRRIESLCIRTSYLFTSYTYYTFRDWRWSSVLRVGVAGTSSSTMGMSSWAWAWAGFSSISIFEDTLVTGMRTVSNSLTLMSRMLFDILEVLLWTDFVSSSFLGLNMLTRLRSSASMGSSSILLSFSSLIVYFFALGCSIVDLVDSVLTKFSGRDYSNFLASSSLPLLDRLADLESAVSMIFSFSELFLPIDCLGVFALLREVLDRTDLISFDDSVCLFISSYFLSNYSSLRFSSSYLRLKASSSSLSFPSISIFYGWIFFCDALKFNCY